MRKPRDLEKYVTPEEVIEALEEIKQTVLARKDINTLMRCDVTLKFWNPDWEKKPKLNRGIRSVP